MHVYRLEDEHGHGPYSIDPYTYDGEAEIEALPPDVRYQVDNDWFTDDDDHPTPFEEPELGDIYDDEHSGFATKQQMRAWFTPDQLHMLHSGGWHLYCFDVPKTAVRKGSRQVAFIRDLATGKHEIPLA